MKGGLTQEVNLKTKIGKILVAISYPDETKEENGVM